MLPRDVYDETLAASAGEFIEIVQDEDLSLPIPTCPGWTLLDLARHLGSVHRWATDCIVTGKAADETDGPTERVELVEWMTAGAARLCSLLAETDLRQSTWTFGPPPRMVAFWLRRQAHETTLHLWDAQNARDSRDVIPAVVAADGVDEVLTMFFPRQVRLGRIPPVTFGVAVELEDAPGVRYALVGDGSDPTAATSATIRGASSDVLLALWGREGLGELSVDGDPEQISAVLRCGIVP